MKGLYLFVYLFLFFFSGVSVVVEAVAIAISLVEMEILKVFGLSLKLFVYFSILLVVSIELIKLIKGW